MLDLVYENHTGYAELKEFFFNNIFNVLLLRFDLNEKQVELGLQIVEAERMQALNKQYRQKNSVTDVLSFPLDGGNLNKCGIIALGDIFLCPSYIGKKAKESGVQFEEEVTRDVIHGFLHLMGYDHEVSKRAEAEMIRLQESIVKLVTKNQ